MTRPAHILLVDDEASIQRSVAPLLRSRGYEVETVGSGCDALKAVAERPPDLIVLDLGLPDIEGTEVCRQVRQTSGLPIIVLSARGNEPDKVSALDLGADDYVTKPFGPEELLARIRVALRRVFSAEDAPAGRLQAGISPSITTVTAFPVTMPTSASRPRNSSCSSCWRAARIGSSRTVRF
jgi:two-component system KDP operon response regulator KdpE